MRRGRERDSNQERKSWCNERDRKRERQTKREREEESEKGKREIKKGRRKI